MICRSIRTYVRLSVCPVHCGKTADRIRMPFGIIGRTGPQMRQWDLRIGPWEGVFLGDLWRAIVTNGDFMVYVCDSPRSGPLVKLLCADLFIPSRCVSHNYISTRKKHMVGAWRTLCPSSMLLPCITSKNWFLPRVYFKFFSVVQFHSSLFYFQVFFYAALCYI